MGTCYSAFCYKSIWLEFGQPHWTVNDFQARSMESNSYLLMQIGILILAIAISNGIPIDDGGLDSFAKVRSFSSSSSNINGDQQDESYFQNGAEINGNPIYLMRGEKQDNDDDLHEALDVILPQENVHSHLDRDNGQESSYEEPLDDSEEFDYPQLQQLDSSDLIDNDEIPEKYDNILDEDTFDAINAQAEEEALEDYYNQILENVV